MRLPALPRSGRILIAAALLLVSLAAWIGIERAKCRAVFAGFQSVERTSTRDDVHKMLGSPNQVFTGTDVLSKLYWGNDLAVAPNEGEVVRDERYTYGGVWGSYLVVIGFGPDGSVRSKFFYG